MCLLAAARATLSRGLGRLLAGLAAALGACSVCLAQVPSGGGPVGPSASAPVSQVAPPEAQRRIALVIGNSAYPSAPLTNPVNDANDMAEVLRQAGFMVLLHTNVAHREMQLALRDFGERLKAGGGTGLFYFAGHGVQIKGRNFLIPAHTDIAHEDEVAYAALDAQAVLDKMESAGSGTNIVVLDACRNNPFVRSARGATRGLAQMDAPVGSLVAFSTAPGSVAIDNRPGLRNGLFTTHLLEAIRRPGLKVEDVLKQVRSAVLRASANRQVPWESSALVGDFYFHPPRIDGVAAAAVAVPTEPAARPPVAVDGQAALDDALWEAVKDSRSSAELFAYLHRFPAGRHAREARRRLLDLATPAPTAPSPGAPAAAPEGAATSGANAAVVAARMQAEEVARWGAVGTERRPEAPRRNEAGFAEGDRFRYKLLDMLSGGGVSHYLWNVDRVDADGSVWVNGGRQRLDTLGQRRGGNDERTGVWLDFAPPLPVAELAARGAGVTLPLQTTVQVRDAQGRLERVSLQGTVRTFADEVSGPAGTAHMMPAVRVEVRLAGQGAVAGGPARKVEWIHHYWMAPPLLLPAQIEVSEFVDDMPRQRSRHEMVSIDQLSLPLPAR